MNVSGINTSVAQVLAQTSAASAQRAGSPPGVGSDADGGPAAGNDHDADDVGAASVAATTPKNGQHVNISA